MRLDQARKAHVEHVLGPSKRAPLHRINDKGRLQLDLRRTTTNGSSSSSGGSSVERHNDGSGDGGVGTGSYGGSGGSGGSGHSKRGKTVSKRRLTGREGSGGGEESKKNASVGAKKKKQTWREKLSQRRASGKKGVGETQHTKDGEQAGGGRSKTTTAGAAKAESTDSANKSRKKAATVDTAQTKAVPKAATADERRERSPSAGSTDASVDVENGGDGRHHRPHHRTDKRRQSAEATARSREDSASSSFLTEESTGRKPQASSEYFSQEGYSSRTQESYTQESYTQGSSWRTQESEKEWREGAKEREWTMKHSSGRYDGGSGHGGSRRSRPSRASITESSMSISGDWQTGRTHITNSSDGGDETSGGGRGGGGRGGGGEEKGKQQPGRKAQKNASSADVGGGKIPPQPDTSRKERSSTRRSPKFREGEGGEKSKEVMGTRGAEDWTFIAYENWLLRMTDLLPPPAVVDDFHAVIFKSPRWRLQSTDIS